MSWENALPMKLSNDVESMKLRLPKWVKTTHFFLQCIYATSICGVLSCNIHGTLSAVQSSVHSNGLGGWGSSSSSSWPDRTIGDMYECECVCIYMV